MPNFQGLGHSTLGFNIGYFPSRFAERLVLKPEARKSILLVAAIHKEEFAQRVRIFDRGPTRITDFLHDLF